MYIEVVFVFIVEKKNVCLIIYGVTLSNRFSTDSTVYIPEYTKLRLSECDKLFIYFIKNQCDC